MIDYTELPEGSLGQYLRMVRTSKGISVKSLSQETGISPCLIYHYELNIHEPGIYGICRLCHALDIPIEEIYKIIMQDTLEKAV